MTISWTVRPDEAWGQLAEREIRQIEAEIVRLVDGLTDNAASWMRAEARWVDRTGDARASLYADLIHDTGRTVSMLLSHGPTIHYAHFLEANPRYAILGDAVDWFAPVLFRGVQDIVRRHGGR